MSISQARSGDDVPEEFFQANPAGRGRGARYYELGPDLARETGMRYLRVTATGETEYLCDVPDHARVVSFHGGTS